MKIFNARKEIIIKIKNKTVKSMVTEKKKDSYARVDSARVDFSKVK